MRTLSDAREVTELRARLAALTMEDARQWGTMSIAEMVCHLRGAFRLAMGQAEAVPVRKGPPPRLIQMMALWMPVRWPRSLPTVAGLERGRALVAPGWCAEDHAELMAAFEEFVGTRENRTAHPILGAMSPRAWMRWGYLHTDHHLRQFGR